MRMSVLQSMPFDREDQTWMNFKELMRAGRMPILSASTIKKLIQATSKVECDVRCLTPLPSVLSGLRYQKVDPVAGRESCGVTGHRSPAIHR